jgi:hypothetical protein
MRFLLQQLSLFNFASTDYIAVKVTADDAAQTAKQN